MPVLSTLERTLGEDRRDRLHLTTPPVGCQRPYSSLHSTTQLRPLHSTCFHSLNSTPQRGGPARVLRSTNCILPLGVEAHPPSPLSARTPPASAPRGHIQTGAAVATDDARSSCECGSSSGASGHLQTGRLFARGLDSCSC